MTELFIVIFTFAMGLVVGATVMWMKSKNQIGQERLLAKRMSIKAEHDEDNLKRLRLALANHQVCGSPLPKVEDAKAVILEAHLDKPEGRSKLAASMVQPLRQRRDKARLRALTVPVAQLPPGALPAPPTHGWHAPTGTPTDLVPNDVRVRTLGLITDLRTTLGEGMFHDDDLIEFLIAQERKSDPPEVEESDDEEEAESSWEGSLVAKSDNS